MQSCVIREGTYLTHREGSGTKEADWSDVARNQGMPAATKSWKDFPLEPPEEAQPYQYFEFDSKT